jgi:hypothetical protein
MGSIQAPPPCARKEVLAMNDALKLAAFLLALYGAYVSAMKAWRLGAELLG